MLYLTGVHKFLRATRQLGMYGTGEDSKHESLCTDMIYVHLLDTCTLFNFFPNSFVQSFENITERFAQQLDTSADEIILSNNTTIFVRKVRCIINIVREKN